MKRRIADVLDWFAVRLFRVSETLSDAADAVRVRA
jgi:hypothetical protein